jgi:hypothetical protein
MQGYFCGEIGMESEAKTPVYKRNHKKFRLVILTETGWILKLFLLPQTSNEQ